MNWTHTPSAVNYRGACGSEQFRPYDNGGVASLQMQFAEFPILLPPLRPPRPSAVKFHPAAKFASRHGLTGPPSPIYSAPRCLRGVPLLIAPYSTAADGPRLFRPPPLVARLPPGRPTLPARIPRHRGTRGSSVVGGRRRELAQPAARSTGSTAARMALSSASRSFRSPRSTACSASSRSLNTNCSERSGCRRPRRRSRSSFLPTKSHTEVFWPSFTRRFPTAGPSTCSATARAAVYAYRHPELPIDLRHECTHALLHANLPMVPLWLDEGLAEYFEMPEAERRVRPSAPGGAQMESAARHDADGRIARTRRGSQRHGRRRVPVLLGVGSLHAARPGRPPIGRSSSSWPTFCRGDPPGPLSQRLRAAVPHLDDRMVQHFKQWRRRAGRFDPAYLFL